MPIIAPPKEEIYENKENLRNNILGKKTKKNEAHYTYYEKKNETPKGFCDMEEFIKRQMKTTLLGKKINPNCKKTFKKKGKSKTIKTNFTDNDGEKYTCILENNPDKIKNKFDAQLVCPVELEGKTYDYKKHKTEDCFI